MKVLVIYDSVFGNTEKIAQVLQETMAPLANVEIFKVGELSHQKLTSHDLLIIGSPTRQFRPTPALSQFLKKIPDNYLKGINTAVFDTRFSESEIKKIRILWFFVKIFGYAAESIAKHVQRKGAELIVPPEPFYVVGTEGPLKAGEIERVKHWADQIFASATHNDV
ncbi:flavodoxin family protein [candidate division KSB1 bacterium]|nr:flavodoxin family protein [candidate division KSB1 bacterium]